MKDNRAVATPGAEGRLRQTELIISYVLRGGVILSAAVIALGMLLFYVQMASGHTPLGYPHSIAGLVRRLGHGEPLAIVALGLLILLLTPMARVAISVIVFALERDWLYTAITVLVLIILLVSLLLGQGGA